MKTQKCFNNQTAREKTRWISLKLQKKNIDNTCFQSSFSICFRNSVFGCSILFRFQQHSLFGFVGLLVEIIEEVVEKDGVGQGE